MPVPIGESLRELYRRVVAAWERLVARPGRSIALVSHNAVLGTLLQAVLGLREDAERTSMIAYPHVGISELWLLDPAHDATLPGPITVVRRVGDATYLPAGLLSF